MGHQMFGYARRLNAILLRLALAQGRRGHQREQRLSKAHDELVTIIKEFEALASPGPRAELNNDPFWRVFGPVCEAHKAWTHNTSDLEPIKAPLRAAVAALG